MGCGRHKDGKPVTAYLDNHCLSAGENWEEGFLQGLYGSQVIILLISANGLEGLKKADTNPDNVLLEYLPYIEISFNIFIRF